MKIGVVKRGYRDEMKSCLTGYKNPQIKFLFELRELSGA